MQTYPHGNVVIVIDCNDFDRAASFWSRVLDCQTPHAVSGVYLMLIPAGGGVEILLQQVPEPKTTKNRLHLDLCTPDLDTEVARVTGLGAVQPNTEPHIEHGWT